MQDFPEENVRPVITVKGGNPDVYRLTLTFRTINQARKIIFLVSGKRKAEILRSVFEDSSTTLPVNRILPVNGSQEWIIDREAASLLSIYGREGNVS